MKTIVLLAILLIPVWTSAQEQNRQATTKTSSWKTGFEGYLWFGNQYYAGIPNFSVDDRKVLQGELDLILKKRKTKVIPKIWFSTSPERNVNGKRWTGLAQEANFGIGIEQELPKGITANATYWYFLLSDKAAADLHVIDLSVSKHVKLNEKNSLVWTFFFRNFAPTNNNGPRGGKIYLPHVTFVRQSVKTIFKLDIAAGFNSKGVLGNLKSRTAIKVKAQVLFHLPKGATGPDFTYGGVPNDKERPMQFTYGWSWVF